MPIIFNLILLSLIKDYVVFSFSPHPQSARNRKVASARSQLRTAFSHSRLKALLARCGFVFRRSAMDCPDYADGCKCKLGKGDSCSKLKLLYNYDDTVSNRSLVGLSSDSSVRSVFASSARRTPSIGGNIKETAEASSEEEGPCVLDLPEKAEAVSSPAPSPAIATVNGGANGAATVNGGVNGAGNASTASTANATGTNVSPTILSSLLANGEKKDDSAMSLRPELQLRTSIATPEEAEDVSPADACKKDVAARCGKPLPCSVDVLRRGYA